MQLSSLASPQVVAFANAHAMNSAASSESFFDALHSADWILRDGSGMATLFKLLALEPGFNLNGTDLIPRIVRLFNGRRIAVFGTQEPYLQRGVGAMARECAPESAFVSAHGFLETHAYISAAASHQAELVVLGMGMPRQEVVAAALKFQLRHPCLIICGGAIIDFLAGKTSRAPMWIRRLGMEWVYRLGMEPKRLFRRYVIGNPLFVARAVWLAFAMRR